MKHAGKAAQAGRKILANSFIAIALLQGLALAAAKTGYALPGLIGGLAALWLAFAAFTVLFFRDPQPATPAEPGVIVAPAHGKVDAIEEIEELEVMGGRCRRVSIFLSVFDVHVQYAPAAGKVGFLKHRPGLYLNALLPASALQNENWLMGLEMDLGQGKIGTIGVRMIAGLIARRIIPWAKLGEDLGRGERICLIQFGSRVDLYLPLSSQVAVALGDRVKGGETIVARQQSGKA